MIAGLEEVTEGEIWIGDREVARLAPRERDIAMVFQNYALYPHLTVAKNLGYGLKVRKTPKQEIDRRVQEVARLLGLQDLLDRRPGALSGGQRQRVAMGRAIVREPAAFLMDEPLSNLDAKLRVDMRAELARLHERLGVTTVYVTHDQVEAMTLGSRVAVMRDGTVQQVDTPQTLYREPTNLFVAAFIGSPSMNLVEAEVTDGVVSFAGFRVPLTADRRPRGIEAGTVILGLRPQDFADASTADAGLPRIEVEAAVVEELGSATHVLFTVDAPPVDLEAVRAASDENERATLIATDKRALFTAEVAEGTPVRPGARIGLAVDPARLHFFDPVTGSSLRADTVASVA
jgi:multiple sugar transport system ATP-binding protein